ncbi:PQQ-binding-like beta-propeller repeat protein [Nocardiopsis mangrovi]|uniref:PQQ-binding-like beta-propeller repeat protein n=1 Tax=Nocardiopsis mangrovi TaxID=1179818 RepID=A0ABV9E3T9_9ACTN
MRGSRILPLVLVPPLLSGCAVAGALPFTPPADEPTLESLGLDYPASGISPVEPLLCEDGERDGADCTESGTLRWSIPLEGGDYFVPSDGGEDPDMGLFTTRTRMTPYTRYGGGVLSGTLYATEDDRVRAIDPATGELAWTADVAASVPMLVWEVYESDAGIVAELRRDTGPGSDLPGELALLDPRDGSPVRDAIPYPGENELIGAVGGSAIVRDGELEFAAYDLLSGDRVWSVELDAPPEDDRRRDLFSGTLVGDVLNVRQEITRLDLAGRPDDDASSEEILRFDARTGDAVPGGGEDTDAPVRDRYPNPVLPLDYEKPDEIRRFPTLVNPLEEEPVADPGYAGVGMLHAADGEALIGAACAPDALRTQTGPPAVADALHCDNPRLFALNR